MTQAGQPASYDLEGMVVRPQGAALTESGRVLVVNDNDGAGETRLLQVRGVVAGHWPR